MRSLQDIGDSEALANRFVDRIVLFVEGPGDVQAYTRIAGPGMLADFEIKLPLEDEGGWAAVQKRVRTERDENGNRKVFGLLDGESAAGLGAAKFLLRCEEPMFQCSDPELEGLIFLSGHELENLFFAYTDVSSILASHCKIRSMTDDRPARLSVGLADLTRRFFGAAMFKYTSLEAAVGTQGVKIMNTWFFGSEPNLKSILVRAKAEVERLGGDWSAFVDKLFGLTRTLREHVATIASDENDRERRLVRLADGKSLLIHLRKVVEVRDDVEGHLLTALLKGPYPGIFQDEVRRRTAPPPAPPATAMAA